MNQNFASRLNAFYEASDTFRNYGKLERYGFQSDSRVHAQRQHQDQLSYEYYHDQRTADRGNPSQALSAVRWS